MKSEMGANGQASMTSLPSPIVLLPAFPVTTVTTERLNWNIRNRFNAEPFTHCEIQLAPLSERHRHKAWWPQGDTRFKSNAWFTSPKRIVADTCKDRSGWSSPINVSDMSTAFPDFTEAMMKWNTCSKPNPSWQVRQTQHPISSIVYFLSFL